MKILNKYISVLLLTLLVSFILPANDNPGESGLPRVDRTAVLKAGLNQTVFGEYQIAVYQNYNFVRFRYVDDYSRNLATYNWKEQYWVGNMAPEFDKSRIDLTLLYDSVLLTPEELDRPYPGRNLVQVESSAAPQQEPSAPSSPSSPPDRPRQVSGPAQPAAPAQPSRQTSPAVAVRVDRTAVLKEGLHQTVFGDYWVLVFGDNPVVRFRLSGNCSGNLAGYNWKEQYWLHYADPSFDKSQIDLIQLYDSILLTAEELDREYPGTNLVQVPASLSRQVSSGPATPPPGGSSQTSAPSRPATPPSRSAAPRVDRNAVLREDLNRTVFGDYRVLVFNNYNFLRFRAVDGSSGNLATYNWKEQYWLGNMDPTFDKSQVDLSRLYSSIGLTPDELDRPYPGRDLVQVSGTARSAPPPDRPRQTSVPSAPVRQQSSPVRTEPLRVDRNAELKEGLHQTVFGEYWVLVFDGYDIVNFRMNNDCSETLAVYCWKEQYWVSMKPEFDKSQVDLTRLYSSVALTPEELDRPYPGSDLVQVR